MNYLKSKLIHWVTGSVKRVYICSSKHGLQKSAKLLHLAQDPLFPRIFKITLIKKLKLIWFPFSLLFFLITKKYDHVAWKTEKKCC